MEEEGVVSERYVSRRTADEEAKEAAEEHVEPLPPSYDDVAGWMSALEADGVDVSSGNPDTIPFNPPPCRAPLAVDEEPKKPCINKVGTMQVTSTRAAHQHYAFQMSAEPTRFAVNVPRSESEAHHARLIAQAPHFEWSIRCWHEEQRTRQVYHENPDSGVGYYTEEAYTVQVTTHTASKTIPLTGWVDTSPEKVLPESSDLFTRVAYTNHYTWRTVEEERMFQAWFDGWVNANRRDVHQSYASKYKVAGFKKFLMEVQENTKVPCCYRHGCWFWLTGLLCGGYCYREGLKCISGKRGTQIVKTIWMQRSEQQQSQQGQWIQQQPAAIVVVPGNAVPMAQGYNQPPQVPAYSQVAASVPEKQPYELAKLKELVNVGALNEAEYSAAKAVVLGI
eukprot:gene14413-9294_t